MMSTSSFLPRTDCNSYRTPVHYNSSSSSSPNHNCSGEQSHVQVRLCFYSSQSVSCGMHMFAHNLAPAEAFHPVFRLKGRTDLEA